MTVKVGTNGLDRIGRNYLRALVTSSADLEVVVANDLTDDKTLTHLLKYDSILGHFPEEVPYSDDAIRVGGKEIEAFAERDPMNLPWGELGVDTIIESASFFTDVTEAKVHLDADAKEVLISAPVKSEDITIVMGVNDDKCGPVAHNIISNTSRITNYLVPMVKTLNDGLGIAKGLMITIHACTQNQSLQDGPHKGLRRARVIALSIVPTITDAAKVVALVLPGLRSRLDGYTLRIFTPTGPTTDLTFEVSRETSIEETNEIVKKAIGGRVLVYTDGFLVNKDIETDSASCTLDSQLTKAVGNQVKVVGRHDNEWGYSNRLADLTALVGSKF